MTTTPLPNLGLNSPSTDEPSDWMKSQPDEGVFDVAGIAGWMARRAMQADPALEPKVRSAVRGVVGPSFSDDELKALEARALNAAEMADATALGGLQPGVPVQLSPRQKTAIDGLLGRMGSDDLATRARNAFGEAVKSGRIQVR